MMRAIYALGAVAAIGNAFIVQQGGADWFAALGWAIAALLMAAEAASKR